MERRTGGDCVEPQLKAEHCRRHAFESRPFSKVGLVSFPWCDYCQFALPPCVLPLEQSRFAEQEPMIDGFSQSMSSDIIFAASANPHTGTL